MNRKADDLDKHIGLRLKMRRILMNITQDGLAQKLNITFQQIQKYEKAVNRISATRLYEISEILNVDISYFFEGYSSQNHIKEDNHIDDNLDISVKKENTNYHLIVNNLLNMPASNNKKRIFSMLKEELVTR